MKTAYAVLASASLLALSACGGSDATANNSADANLELSSDNLTGLDENGALPADELGADANSAGNELSGNAAAGDANASGIEANSAGAANSSTNAQ